MPSPISENNEEVSPEVALLVPHDLPPDSDRETAEHARQPTQQRLVEVLESLGDAFYTVDSGFRLTYVNRKAEALWGQPRAELLGKRLLDVFPEMFGSESLSNQERAMAERRPCHYETLSPILDRWIELSAYPIDGGLCVYFRDISSRKQAEEDLRQFQFLADSANDALFLANAEGRFVYVNAAACRSLGYSSEALQTMRVGDINPDYGDAAYRDIFQRLQTETLPPFESIHKRRDGTLFPVESSVSRFHTNGQSLLLSSARDISERRQNEEERKAAALALENAHRRTTAILESIADAFFALDQEWRFTYLNTQAERLLARTRDELHGTCIWGQFPEAVGSAFETQYRRAAATGLAVSFEEFYGPLQTWFDVHAYPSAEGLSIFFRDVNARKQVEDALRRSQQDLQLAIDAGRLGTFYCEWPLDKIIWNETCKEHFFLPSDANVDFALFYSLLHPDDRERTRHAIEEAMAGHVEFNVEYRALAPDGAVRWINAVGRFHYAPDGTPSRFDGVTIDISARKGAEEELRRRAEREALTNRVGQALRASDEPKRILETAVRELGQALSVDRCYYVSYDQGADTAIVGPDWHRDDLPTIAGRYPMSRFVVNRDPVYQAGETQVVTDTANDVASQALGLRALVRVPLVSGTIMTALAVASAQGPREWTPDDVSLVEAVATQTQTALEAVRLQRREHQIAQQLQDALQPALPTRVPGLSIGKYAKAALDEAQVGGDFYDIFLLDKTLYAIVIGDVSGKGLAAAQQLALVRNSLRTMLYLYRNPAQAAAMLNRIVTEHDLLVGFVTVWIGIYDMSTADFCYCSCGHEPALLRDTSGLVRALDSTGPPLGADPDARYREGRFRVSDGESLLLYTDGISEAGPNRRTLLGTHGLSRLLAALPADKDTQGSADTLVEQVIHFARGVFRDDVAVLLMRRHSSNAYQESSPCPSLASSAP